MPTKGYLTLRTKCFAIIALAAMPLLPSAGRLIRGASGAVAKRPVAHRAGNRTAGQMMHMPLVAPLFIQNREFTSTVVLVNDSGTSTYADLVLSRPSGQEITTYRVQFAPLSQRIVKIGDLLASAVSPETTGRVIVRQSPTLRGMPIAAQLSLTYLGTQEPNYIDEETAMPSFEGSQMLRGVADIDQGSPLVAITSLSDSVQHILVECIDEHAKHFSKSVNLLANGTLLTEACSERTIYGGDFEVVNKLVGNGLHGPIGISLTSDAMPGSFAAFGLAHHRKHGDNYFSAVTFSDPKMFPLLFQKATMYHDSVSLIFPPKRRT